MPEIHLPAFAVFEIRIHPATLGKKREQSAYRVGHRTGGQGVLLLSATYLFSALGERFASSVLRAGKPAGIRARLGVIAYLELPAN
jgi:hypothetical protein